jgi:excisionase family DNA binding protein
MADEKRLLRVDEAATRLGIGRTKTWELVNRGELRSVRIGRAVRIVAADVDRFVVELAGELGR